MTSEHPAEGRRRIAGSILYRKKREQHKQLQHLKSGELAVRILDRPDDFALYHYGVYNC